MRNLLAIILLSSCLSHGVSAQDATDPYWQLGVGAYFGGLGTLTELDVARFDWLYLCFGNISADRGTTELLNRLLDINPDLKIVIRLWPTLGLGDNTENNYQATFLHYLYLPGVKEKLQQNIHDQIRVVLDPIKKPENVVGMTFLEELPNHFSANPFRRNGDKLTWDLLRFRKEIEAERGKPLVWDSETRRWWATKWVQVLNEIHTTMKKASDGRLVFYYLQTNHDTLDQHPEGASIEQPRLVPHHWSDVIKPGFCDGFFAYPNNEKIWNEKYVALAQKNNWLMFSQVSHPPFMRLCPWETNVRLAKTRLPQNLGYFFYCQGNCAEKRAWNVDQGIPAGPQWNSLGFSQRLHVRRHLALENVGMDIIARQPALDVKLDLPLASAKPGGLVHARVVVRNQREASFYTQPTEAILRKVSVTLQLPKGFSFSDPSPPTTVELGAIRPDQTRQVDWWFQVPANFQGTMDPPLVVTATAANGPSTTIEATADTSIPFAQPQQIGLSGTRWTEAPFRLEQARIQPRIVIEALANGTRNPTVDDQQDSLTWQGPLDAGQRLILDSQKGARLILGALINDDGRSRSDPADADGFEGFDEGYLVARAVSNAKVDPDVPLRVTISGKAQQDGQSQVVLRFEKKGGHVDQTILVNQFSSKWQTISEQVLPPAEVTSLENVFLYRFQSRGKVWYGPVRVERADATPEGLDVTSQLSGTFPSLYNDKLSVYTYRDEGPLTYTPRIRVQLMVPESK